MNREIELDYLRAIAIVGVILVHTVQSFPTGVYLVTWFAPLDPMMRARFSLVPVVGGRVLNGGISKFWIAWIIQDIQRQWSPCGYSCRPTFAP